jgi:hypothetical protein
VLHHLQLDRYGLLKLVDRALEKLVIVVRKLCFHAAEVTLTQGEKLSRFDIVAFDRKGTLQIFVRPQFQFFNIHFLVDVVIRVVTRVECIIVIILLKAARNNVDDSEAAALDNVNESLVAILWQHVSARSLLDEIDELDGVAFIEHTFLRLGDVRLQKWTEPRDEVLLLVCQVVDLRVDILEYVHG